MAPMQRVGLAHAPSPSANVRETEDEYVVELQVPEFTLGELSLELDDRELTIVGDQHGSIAESVESFQLHEQLGESFRLPDDVDESQVAALFDRGTLEIHAPKRSIRTNGKRDIPIARKRRCVFNADATPC